MGEASARALAERVGELLRQRRHTLATAESCTGGGLGDAITDIPGSSHYYLGGVIAYANAVKEALLEVPHAMLVEHGAVSAEVAVAMAVGARRLLGADLALASTGVAGPGGGTPEKPVGLVYIGLATPGGNECRRYRWAGDRRQNKQQTVRAALEMAIAYLEGRDGPPREGRGA